MQKNQNSDFPDIPGISLVEISGISFVGVHWKRSVGHSAGDAEPRVPAPKGLIQGFNKALFFAKWGSGFVSVEVQPGWRETRPGFPHGAAE